MCGHLIYDKDGSVVNGITDSISLNGAGSINTDKEMNCEDNQVPP